MFRKVSRKKAKDKEKIFLLERKAHSCADKWCSTACTGPGIDFFSAEQDMMCEAP